MSLGPVEYIVVGFPGNKFKGDILPALADLVSDGLIRVMDLAFVRKDAETMTRAPTIRTLATAVSDLRSRSIILGDSTAWAYSAFELWTTKALLKSADST